MSADEYLQAILRREAVDTGPYSPVRGVQTVVLPIVREWAGTQFASLSPSGSFAKCTANSSGTDIDLFISLKQETRQTLKEIYYSLFKRMGERGFPPTPQNVSMGIKVNGYSVDLVPAKRQDTYSEDHSLFRRKADTWTKTNVTKHIATVRQGDRLFESRILKLWRDQKGFDFPSFYLELTSIRALYGRTGTLSANVWTVFQYLRDTFINARIEDPANTNNIISDDLTGAEKAKVKLFANQALAAKDWSDIVK
jgi:hypothetical protein